jgi:osmoprotectant transport system substrate-binding protein
VKFKGFRALDAGGPLTKAALKRGDINIGLIFSSDSSISVDNFVVLQDDKHLQNADDVVPVVRKSAAKSDVVSVLNNVSSKLTTNDLIDMNKKADVDRQDPSAIASSWLGSKGISTSSSGASKGTLKVGGFNFSESSILAQIYAQALKGAGYNVTLRLNLGSREVVAPALERGDIDLYPGYAATELEFFDGGKGLATPNATETVSKLNSQVSSKGLQALDPSSALDTNAFAVTKATADKYHISKLSDLSKTT